MAQIVTARRKGVNCLAEGWVDSLAEIPFRWVNYLAEGWVDSLAEIPLKWVVCLAVDTGGAPLHRALAQRRAAFSIPAPGSPHTAAGGNFHARPDSTG